MNHPDWPAFVAAIVAEPDEDTPRLVAADFLEEHGDADRAAFIRVQVELVRLERPDLRNSPAAVELRQRERAFLGPRAEAGLFWAAQECPELVRMPASRPGAPLTGLHPIGAERLTWRRGFVEAVRCPAAEWLRHGAAVRGRNPIRWVMLDECAVLDRDWWYAGLGAVRGLATVVLVDGDRDAREWLTVWLPGTEVLAPLAG